MLVGIISASPVPELIGADQDIHTIDKLLIESVLFVHTSATDCLSQHLLSIPGRLQV